MSVRSLAKAFVLVLIPLMLAAGFVVSGQDESDTLLLRARELRQAQVYLESVRFYRAYVDENPDDLNARIELGELLLVLDEPVEAANQVIPILREDPNRVEAKKVFEDSLVLIEQSLDTSNNLGILQIARLHRAAGDRVQAEANYRNFLERVPDDPIALHEFAQMTYDGGSEDEGLSLLEEAILHQSETELRQELLLKKAIWLSYEMETMDDSVESFEGILEEYPTLAEAHIRLGDLYRFRGDYEDAGRSYLAGIQHGGRDDRAIEGYYLVLLRTRALEHARKAKVLGEFPEASSFYSLHFKEMELTRQRLAEIELLEARDLASPEQRQAAEFFRRFLAETPDEADIRLESAQTYAEMEQYRLATQEIAAAIALRPSDKDLQLQLARFQTYDADMIDDAGSTLDEIADSFGPDAEVMALRGDVYRFQGDYVAASRAYRESFATNPNDPRALAGVEAIGSIFRPEFFGGIGLTRDWSSDYDHFNLDLGARNVFSGIEHQIDIGYRFLYYTQPTSTQNPALTNRTKDVTGNELYASASGPIEGPWSYLATLGGVFYDNVDGTVLGRLGIGYSTKQLAAVFGFRRREAVFEHYDLSALLDEVRTNDFYGQAIYVIEGDEIWERWQIEGFGESGWFSDGNYRTRLIGTVLNRMIDEPDQALKVGLRGLWLNYDDESANYFSPSDYYGGGVTGRYDRRIADDTNGGITGTVLWIEQVEEFDIAIGGYLDHQISESSRASVRLDYGESTFQQGDIRSFSGRAEVQIVF